MTPVLTPSPCPDCGQPVGIGPVRRGRHLECYRASRRVYDRARRVQQGRGPVRQTYAGICEGCFASFQREVRTCLLVKYGGVVRYCSQRCAQTTWERRRRAELAALPPTGTRPCTSCGAWKPLTPEHWHRNVCAADGFAQPCAPCHNRKERIRHALALSARLELATSCRCGAALVPGSNPLTGEGVDWCPSCRRGYVVPRRWAA